MSKKTVDYIEFIVVRHGETVENQEGRVQGQKDGTLDNLGIQQASAAAAYLRDMVFNAAYSSDLKRAMDTAKIVVASGHPNVVVEPTPGLREWHLGDLEGRYQRDLAKECPAVMRAFLHEQDDVPVPHGESKSEFLLRVETCLAKLASACAKGDRILLVTHGGVMQMILRMVVGEIKRENLLPFTANASISMIRYYPDDKGWQLISWNQTDHLKSLPIHPTLVC